MEGDAVMVLVIEKRIPCGGCREEDSPITIWKEGFKRKGGGGGMKQSKQPVQFGERTDRDTIVPFSDSLAVTSG